MKPIVFIMQGYEDADDEDNCDWQNALDDELMNSDEEEYEEDINDSGNRTLSC
jgi:hypothetical protein